MSWCSVVLVLCLVTVGCAPHRAADLSRQDTLPDRFQQQQSVAPRAALTRWWLAFDDQQLNRLMEQLFAGNLELRQMFARLEQVEAAVGIARSSGWPVVSADGRLSRARQPGVSGQTGLSGQPAVAGAFTGDSRQLSLAASFEVDLWGRLAAQARAAELDLAATEEDLLTLYLTLSARLADLYFLAREQHAQLVLTDQLIASFSDTNARVERRYRSGLVPALDVYQSRQSLAGAKASRQLYEARMAEAEHALAVLLGTYPVRGSGLADQALPTAPALFAPGAPVDLLGSRPDLLAGLRRIEAADQRVAAAVAERFPAISLSGNYGTLRQEITGGILSGPFWSLLGNLTLPLVDGGRRRAEVARRQAALQEAGLAYRQQVLTAFQEVEDALVNNHATERRIEHLTATAAATAASLRQATERYHAGLTDYLPVLTAQRGLLETRSQLLAAKRQLLNDRISLARALGGGWMREQLDDQLQRDKDSQP